MSEPAPSGKTEPHPFEKFRDFARRIIAVPKAEADAREHEWRKHRKDKKEKNRP